MNGDLRAKLDRFNAALARMGRPPVTDRPRPAARTTRRPPGVEWDPGAGRASAPHGAPLLVNGRLQAGYRDATFYGAPNEVRDTQVHVMVAAAYVRNGQATGWEGAACDPRRIVIDTECLERVIVRDAADIPPAVRCRRPGCARLYEQADAEAE